MDNRIIDFEAEFAITIDYQKGEGNPARVFRTMTGLVETFQIFNRNFVNVIDANVESVIFLDEIEIGSIKSVFRDALRAIPDDAIFHLDIRPIFGQVLLMAKKVLIDFTTDKDTITSNQELYNLIDRLNELTDQSQIKMLPSYKPIKPRAILEPLEYLSHSIANLEEGDKATYNSRVGVAYFNPKFRITPEAVEDLISKEVKDFETEMILRVKRPDFLGDSMWDFRHGSSIFPATINDKDWLKKYQLRQIELRPLDAIKANVRTVRKYDYDSELIAERYYVTKVMQVLSGGEQGNLL
jgi:hypothetical protein